MRRKSDTKRPTAGVMADECIAVRLRLLTRAVTKLYNNALRSCGVTISQMNILVAVSHMGDTAGQRDVCRVLLLDKSTLSRDVERMLARGWLRKIVPDEDRRSGLLQITPAGETLLERTYPAWSRAQAQARRLLREDEVVGLNRVVRALRSGKSSAAG